MPGSDFDAIRDKKLKLSDIKFLRSTPRKGRPEEIEDGVIYYFGQTYYFKFHHEFDEGNTYIVYDGSGNSIAYFVMQMGDAEEEQTVEEMGMDSPSIVPQPED